MKRLFYLFIFLLPIKFVRLWSVEGNKQPSFIRNVGDNYKNFFFGTINTR
jgi:hypothetical protein